MKKITLQEWHLTPWKNKGFAGEGLETIFIRDDGARLAVVVFEGENRLSWQNGDPTPEQSEWK